MFTIDPMSRIPVYEQIIAQVERYVSLGILKPGDAMPSVRSLSMELSINPNTVQKTFSELFNRGLIVSVPGRGSFIANEAPEILKRKSRDKIDDFRLLVRELYTAGLSAEELMDAVKTEIQDMNDKTR